MKQRYWLFKRGSTYYLQDSDTGRQTSLRTTDQREAERLRDAKNDGALNPVFALAMAKAYLSQHDPKLVERTWDDAINEFIQRSPRDSTRLRRQRAAKAPEFDLIRGKKLVETTGADALAFLSKTGAFGNAFFRCIHNLALGFGWLVWPVIPPRLWPQVKASPKRAITSEEHEKIIANERDEERRFYYQVLWHIGASQSDAAGLTAENINWALRLLSFNRKKTGELCQLRIGPALENLFRALPQEGMLFPKTYRTLDKHRAAEFRRRCRVLKIDGVSLHSYRYAWAERAKELGIPERLSQAAQGHSSVSVHRAYAKNGKAICPALDEYHT